MNRFALLVACAFLVPCSAWANDSASAVDDGLKLWAQQRYEAAIVVWKGPAESGDPEAQYHLAMAYRDGKGVPLDLTQAEDYLRKAAQKGHFEASDEYGILLFQSARVKEAMPWILASAERGEPRAQYFLGIAKFNGDDVQKDWIYAYALMTRAASTGLAPAITALAEMDNTIPLEDRQKGIKLADELEANSRETRNRQLASLDLAETKLPSAPGAATVVPQVVNTEPALTPFTPEPAKTAPPLPPPLTPSTPAATNAAPVQTPPAAEVEPATEQAPAPAPAMPQPQATKPESAQPSTKEKPSAKEKSSPKPAPKAKEATKQAAKPKGILSGKWRIQLGAFAIKSNAEALWNKLRRHPVLSDRKRMDVAEGGLVRLQAGPFASEAEARQACKTLGTSHKQCIIASR